VHGVGSPEAWDVLHEMNGTTSAAPGESLVFEYIPHTCTNLYITCITWSHAGENF
jgi:hypothetical protein